MKKIYLTGSTGFLGSHFLRRHLLNGEYDVTCLVRGRNEQECLSRVRSAVLEVDNHYLDGTRLRFDGLTARPADITLPLLGTKICATQVEAETAGVFFHFASSLNFEEKIRDVIYLHNISGLINAFEVARALRCNTFYYISTAYTAGTRSGEVYESLHDGTEFNNYYEETKCLAEHHIDKLCAEHGIGLVIVRPSIVIGPYATKTNGGSGTGLYGMLREFHRLKRPMRNTREQVKLFANPDARINFVPVDEVCRDIMRIYQSADRPSGIFHATASTTFEVTLLSRMISSALGLRDFLIEDCSVEDAQEASAIDRLLAKRTVFYNPYIRNTKTFIRANGTGCVLTDEDLQQYIALAVKTLNERKPGVPRRHVVVTPDNVPLNIYASNQQRSETVIFVNAVGMPLEFADRLREAVEKDYRFITWESRGIPSPIEDIDKIDIDTDAHVKDLVCICEHFGLKKVHVIGWCSGAYIAYQARNVSYIASLTLINGAYGLVESIGAETAFARNLRQVLPVIAASRDNADRFHAFCFARSVDDDSDTATGSRQAVEILGATDPSLVHLTSLPFESPESLYRYSRVICALGVTVQRSEIMPLDLPCHVIVGSGDETINPQESRMFTELHEGVKYSEIAGMDHYGVYNHPTLLSTITTYLGSLKNLVEDQTPSSTE